MTSGPRQEDESEGEGESSPSLSFGVRRSLRALFGSLGKGRGRQRKSAPETRWAGDPRDGRKPKPSERPRSQFYVELPSDTTCDSSAPNPQPVIVVSPARAQTLPAGLSPSSMLCLPPVATRPPPLPSVGSHRYRFTLPPSPHARLGDGEPGGEGRTCAPGQDLTQGHERRGRRPLRQLGVLVIPESLTETPAYRRRLGLADQDFPLPRSSCDSAMGGEMSKGEEEEEEEISEHTVTAPVHHRYMNVVSELNQVVLKSLSLRRSQGGDEERLFRASVCDSDSDSDNRSTDSDSDGAYVTADSSGIDVNGLSDVWKDSVNGEEVMVTDGKRDVRDGVVRGKGGMTPEMVSERKDQARVIPVLCRDPPAGLPVGVEGGDPDTPRRVGCAPPATPCVSVSASESEHEDTPSRPLHPYPDSSPAWFDPNAPTGVPSATNPDPGSSRDVSPAPASASSSTTESRDRKVFLIAQEVMTSERVFVDVLRLLNVDFRNFVLGLSKDGKGEELRAAPAVACIPESELNKILNYLPQLQNLNEEILSDLEARITGWERHCKISDVLVRKGPFLKLYSAYIKEFQQQCDYLDECCAKYPLFARALKDFEASERCAKLSLKHYMLKPVQRIPQYRLLLEDYLKKLPEDGEDYVDTQTALAVVANVAAHANDAMKQGTVLGYEDKNMQGASYELVRPGRYLLKEGELMKLCRRGMQPRYFILLSDVLLYTSPMTSGPHGALRLNYELPLEGMRVDTPKAEDFKNEFSVISTSRSFTLQASTAEERDEWIKALREAIEDNASRRSTFLQAKMPTYQQPATSTLGKQAPVWIPDYRVTMCQQCTAEFTLTFRRHHCRACGKVVCDHCSSNRAPLQYKRNQVARVCDTCFEVLQKDFESKYEGSMSLEDTQEARIRRVSSLKAQFKRGIRDSNRNKTRKKVPERLMEVCASDEASQMCGYLRMMVRRSWRRGWFVLKDRVLYEYRAPEDVCALQSFPVLGYAVETTQDREMTEGIDACLVFQLTHCNQPPLVFQADTPHLAEKWIGAMREAVVLT
ncbi:FYVE, RhoGEF and PH domain-containing protein 6-like [Penaeus indicus]|uniref:FYVE, RhoGEF and PH domain-containing protein 6-like n=1 Tax=Penaeus indicus TaxID=29960 RepID=UPI00300CBA81